MSKRWSLSDTEVLAFDSFKSSFNRPDIIEQIAESNALAAEASKDSRYSSIQAAMLNDPTIVGYSTKKEVKQNLHTAYARYFARDISETALTKFKVYTREVGMSDAEAYQKAYSESTDDINKLRYYNPKDEQSISDFNTIAFRYAGTKGSTAGSYINVMGEEYFVVNPVDRDVKLPGATAAWFITATNPTFIGGTITNLLPGVGPVKKNIIRESLEYNNAFSGVGEGILSSNSYQSATWVGMGLMVAEMAIVPTMFKGNVIKAPHVLSNMMILNSAMKDLEEQTGLSKRYLFGNKRQDPHIQEFVNSRLFDIFTIHVSNYLSTAIQAGIGSKIAASQISSKAKDIYTSQALLLGDVAFDTALDFSTHNLLQAANVEFTEGQKKQLGLIDGYGGGSGTEILDKLGKQFMMRLANRYGAKMTQRLVTKGASDGIALKYTDSKYLQEKHGMGKIPATIAAWSNRMIGTEYRELISHINNDAVLRARLKPLEDPKDPYSWTVKDASGNETIKTKDQDYYSYLMDKQLLDQYHWFNIFMQKERATNIYFQDMFDNTGKIKNWKFKDFLTSDPVSFYTAKTLMNSFGMSRRSLSSMENRVYRSPVYRDGKLVYETENISEGTQDPQRFMSLAGNIGTQRLELSDNLSIDDIDAINKSFVEIIKQHNLSPQEASTLINVHFGEYLNKFKDNENMQKIIRNSLSQQLRKGIPEESIETPEDYFNAISPVKDDQTPRTAYRIEDNVIQNTYQKIVANVGGSNENVKYSFRGLDGNIIKSLIGSDYEKTKDAQLIEMVKILEQEQTDWQQDPITRLLMKTAMNETEKTTMDVYSRVIEIIKAQEQIDPDRLNANSYTEYDSMTDDAMNKIKSEFAKGLFGYQKEDNTRVPGLVDNLMNQMIQIANDQNIDIDTKSMKSIRNFTLLNTIMNSFGTKLNNGNDIYFKLDYVFRLYEDIYSKAKVNPGTFYMDAIDSETMVKVKKSLNLPEDSPVWKVYAKMTMLNSIQSNMNKNQFTDWMQRNRTKDNGVNYIYDALHLADGINRTEFMNIIISHAIRGFNSDQLSGFDKIFTLNINGNDYKIHTNNLPDVEAIIDKIRVDRYNQSQSKVEPKDMVDITNIEKAFAMILYKKAHIDFDELYDGSGENGKKLAYDLALEELKEDVDTYDLPIDKSTLEVGEDGYLKVQYTPEFNNKKDNLLDYMFNIYEKRAMTFGNYDYFSDRNLQDIVNDVDSGDNLFLFDGEFLDPMRFLSRAEAADKETDQDFHNIIIGITDSARNFGIASQGIHRFLMEYGTDNYRDMTKDQRKSLRIKLINEASSRMGFTEKLNLIFYKTKWSMQDTSDSYLDIKVRSIKSAHNMMFIDVATPGLKPDMVNEYNSRLIEAGIIPISKSGSNENTIYAKVNYLFGKPDDATIRTKAGEHIVSMLSEYHRYEANDAFTDDTIASHILNRFLASNKDTGQLEEILKDPGTYLRNHYTSSKKMMKDFLASAYDVVKEVYDTELKRYEDLETEVLKEEHLDRALQDIITIKSDLQVQLDKLGQTFRADVEQTADEIKQNIQFLEDAGEVLKKLPSDISTKITTMSTDELQNTIDIMRTNVQSALANLAEQTGLESVTVERVIDGEVQTKNITAIENLIDEINDKYGYFQAEYKKAAPNNLMNKHRMDLIEDLETVKNNADRILGKSGKELISEFYKYMGYDIYSQIISPDKFVKRAASLQTTRGLIGKTGDLVDPLKMIISNKYDENRKLKILIRKDRVINGVLQDDGDIVMPSEEYKFIQNKAGGALGIGNKATLKTASGLMMKIMMRRNAGTVYTNDHQKENILVLRSDSDTMSQIHGKPDEDTIIINWSTVKSTGLSLLKDLGLNEDAQKTLLARYNSNAPAEDSTMILLNSKEHAENFFKNLSLHVPIKHQANDQLSVSSQLGYNSAYNTLANRYYLDNQSMVETIIGNVNYQGNMMKYIREISRKMKNGLHIGGANAGIYTLKEYFDSIGRQELINPNEITPEIYKKITALHRNFKKSYIPFSSNKQSAQAEDLNFFLQNQTVMDYNLLFDVYNQFIRSNRFSGDSEHAKDVLFEAKKFYGESIKKNDAAAYKSQIDEMLNILSSDDGYLIKETINGKDVFFLTGVRYPNLKSGQLTLIMLRGIADPNSHGGFELPQHLVSRIEGGDWDGDSLMMLGYSRKQWDKYFTERFKSSYAGKNIEDTQLDLTTAFVYDSMIANEKARLGGWRDVQLSTNVFSRPDLYAIPTERVGQFIGALDLSNQFLSQFIDKHIDLNNFSINNGTADLHQIINMHFKEKFNLTEEQRGIIMNSSLVHVANTIPFSEENYKNFVTFDDHSSYSKKTKFKTAWNVITQNDPIEFDGNKYLVLVAGDNSEDAITKDLILLKDVPGKLMYEQVALVKVHNPDIDLNDASVAVGEMFKGALINQDLSLTTGTTMKDIEYNAFTESVKQLTERSVFSDLKWDTAIQLDGFAISPLQFDTALGGAGINQASFRGLNVLSAFFGKGIDGFNNATEFSNKLKIASNIYVTSLAKKGTYGPNSKHYLVNNLIDVIQKDFSNELMNSIALTSSTAEPNDNLADLYTKFKLNTESVSRINNQLEAFNALSNGSYNVVNMIYDTLENGYKDNFSLTDVQVLKKSVSNLTQDFDSIEKSFELAAKRENIFQTTNENSKLGHDLFKALYVINQAKLSINPLLRPSKRFLIPGDLDEDRGGDWGFGLVDGFNYDTLIHNGVRLGYALVNFNDNPKLQSTSRVIDSYLLQLKESPLILDSGIKSIDHLTQMISSLQKTSSNNSMRNYVTPNMILEILTKDFDINVSNPKVTLNEKAMKTLFDTLLQSRPGSVIDVRKSIDAAIKILDESNSNDQRISVSEIISHNKKDIEQTLSIDKVISNIESAFVKNKDNVKKLDAMKQVAGFLIGVMPDYAQRVAVLRSQGLTTEYAGFIKGIIKNNLDIKMNQTEMDKMFNFMKIREQDLKIINDMYIAPEMKGDLYNADNLLRNMYSGC